MPEANLNNPQQSTTTVATPKNPINWRNILIGVIIGAVLLGGGGYLVYNAYQPKSSEPTVTTTKKATSSAKPATPSAKPDETAGWKTYDNKDLAISFKYPQNCKLAENQQAFWYDIYFNNYETEFEKYLAEKKEWPGIFIYVQASKEKSKFLEDVFSDHYQEIKNLGVGKSMVVDNYTSDTCKESGGSGCGPYDMTYTREADTVVSNNLGLTFNLEAKSEYSSYSQHLLVLEKNEYVYKLYLSLDQTDDAANLLTFKRFLSTFKFL